MDDLDYLISLDSQFNEREENKGEYVEFAKLEAEKKLPKTIRQSIKMDINNKVIVLSASLIKELLYKGSITDHCPHKIYKKYITGEWRGDFTESQLKGLFFESLCIGGSADGSITLDLPRKPVKKGQKVGDKTADQIRLEEQALIFAQTYPKYGMVIMKEGEYKNVQKEFCIEWQDPKYKTYADYKIYLQGTLDIVSPLTFNGRTYPAAIVDLKTTKSRKSTFGKYAWGNAGKENDGIDHIQAYLYHYALELPFFYWIWDYPAKDEERGNEIIPMKPFDDGSDETMLKIRELHESLRKSIELIIKYHCEEWPENGNFHSVCENCMGNPKHGGQCQIVNNVREI